MTASAEPTAAGSKRDRRVPDFFIVGHHKSGTTALYEMLRRHPQIYMPDVKEPRFFADDLRALLGHIPGIPETFEEYLSLFDAATPEQRIGEASPSYLRSSSAARAIAELQPAARIIAILREPASFVRSLHLQLVKEHVETETDLRRAVANEEITRNGRRVHRYSDHVRYVEQLRRYHDVFAPEQVLVLIYDDFRRDNAATVRRVLRFIGVDDSQPVAVVEVNRAVSVRSPRLDTTVRAMHGGSGPLSRAARASLRALTPGPVRRGASRAIRRHVVYSDPPPPDENFMRELRRRFKPQVVALGDYMQRDLVTLWGYHDLG
jgi:hypothetical protein